LVIIVVMMRSAVLFLLLLQTAGIRAWGDIQGPECNGVIYGAVLDPSGQPARGISVSAEPLGVLLGAILPYVKTDDAGKYRFQNLCFGRYTVISDDERVAYRGANSYMNRFLYGSRIAEVRLTAKHPQAELHVSIPPKPGFVRVHITNQETKADLVRFSLKVKVPGQQKASEVSFNPMVKDYEIVVPPDKDVIVHLTADGFHEWSESAGHGKLLRVPSGTRVTLEADLEPLSGRKPNRLRQGGFQ
jgi:hypothetical protein